MSFPKSFQVFRDAIPASEIASLARFVDDAYAFVDAEKAAGTLNSDFAQTYEWGGLALAHLTKHFAGAQPAMAVARRIERLYSGSIIEHECSFRRHTGPSTYAGWHADADAAGSAPFDPCFNAWVPLVPVGVAAPSVEFVLDSELAMRSAPPAPLPSRIWSDEWRLDQFAGHEIACPSLDPGDVVVFSHYILHRTQPMAVGARRVSGEFRFTTKKPAVERSRAGKLLAAIKSALVGMKRG